ncbi:SpoIIE family protein phosphatase [Micromonospora sp. CPCC 206061]|uniref:SpoIIE family protein phosphatase n=1 Tax=Micromonospora sp. CPCC 206061 TaxID=3122410 RepID=UPI002FEF1CFA
MLNRAVIEQAKGVMAARLGVPPQEAFDRLMKLSQDTNTKVAGVAAAVVGAAIPDPPQPETEPVVDDQLRTRVAEELPASQGGQPVTPPARPAGVEALHTFHQIIGARAAAARDHDELAEALAVAAPGWPQPRAVSICGLEPDGALRLLGAHGLTVLQRSQWTRMPPQLEVPVTRAVRCRAPVVASTPDVVKQEFPALADSANPPAAAVALPLTDGEDIVGSAGLSWSTPLRLRGESERYLLALAEPVSIRLSELSGGADLAAGAWLSIPLEAMHNPAVLLAPVPSGAAIATDFRVVRANSYAKALCRAGGVELAGATLLSLFPYAGSQALLAACRDVVAGTALHHLDLVRLRPDDVGGQDAGSVSARVAAVADKVLLVWHPHTSAESSYEQLLRAEAVARIGSFRWEPHSGVVHLSPYLMMLLGLDDERLTDVDAVLDRIDEADRPAARRLLRALMTGGGRAPQTQVFRGAGRILGRSLQVTVEPAQAAAVVVGTVQDVTEQRLLEARLRKTEIDLAGQRQAAAVRTALASAMLPAPKPLAAKHVTADGACRPGAHSFGTAWHDAAELPGGDVLLMAGLAAGSAPDAMVGAGRIRHAVRSYAVVRRGPGEILTATNALVRFDRPGLTAGIVLARYAHAHRRVRWASAGTGRPIHFRGEAAGTILASADAPPLGAEPATAYEERELPVAAGDRLLLHVHMPAGQPAVHTLAGAAARIEPETVSGLLDEAGDDMDRCVIVARFNGG